MRTLATLDRKTSGCSARDTACRPDGGARDLLQSQRLRQTIITGDDGDGDAKKAGLEGQKDKVRPAQGTGQLTEIVATIMLKSNKSSNVATCVLFIYLSYKNIFNS